MKLHHHRTTRKLLVGVTAILATTSLIACSQQPQSLEETSFPDYYPSEYSEIVEASKDEVNLDVYSIMAEEDWAPLLDGFAKLYPWVNVRTVDLGTTEVFERYYAELSTGSPTADAIVSIAADGWQRFIDRGELQAYESPELGHLPDWAGQWASHGLYAMSTDPFSIVYNTALLPEGAEPPASLADVTKLVTSDPEYYKGRVATYAGDAQWGMFWFAEQHHGDAFWTDMDAMAEAGALRFEASGGAIGEKMVSGEYAVAFYVPLSTIPRGSEDFLKFSLMEDGQVVSDRTIGVTKEAKSPNSAKLLIDFLLSAAGQTLIPLMERVPYRPDVRGAVEATGWWHLEGIVDDLGEDGVIHMGPVPEILADGEYDRIVAGFKNLG